MFTVGEKVPGGAGPPAAGASRCCCGAAGPGWTDGPDPSDHGSGRPCAGVVTVRGEICASGEDEGVAQDAESRRVSRMIVTV